MRPTPLPDRFRRQAVRTEEAQLLLLEQIRPLDAERVPLYEAWGRTIAEPIVSPHAFPPFRRSGMDGYAVRVADLADATPESPAELAVVEELPSGVEPSKPIGPGQSSRIMTGGMLPEGADAVVMLEMTTHAVRADGVPIVRIGKAVESGRNVAEIGCEIESGILLLREGTTVRAGESAVLAACGYASVPVVRRPRVAILSTGSELLGVEEPLVPAKIRNSNAPMLSAMAREAGAEPVLFGQVPDVAEQADAIVKLAAAQCDLVLTSGGVSVGDYDVMVDVLAGADLLFNKVTMRPGSPTTAAIAYGKPLVALSGNPGACFVGFHLFALPAIKAMLRAEDPYPSRHQAYLGVPFPKVNAYRRFVRARTEIRDGAVWVYPTGDDKSSLMTTILGADCLIDIPPLKSGLEAGHPVAVWRLS